MNAIPVILDTDIGSDIDDTWALAALLQSPELGCRLITTASGDTCYRATVVAKLLECAGREDIPIGIGISGGKMLDCHCHQGPWVAGYDLENFPGKVYSDGVDAMIEAVYASETPVTIISIAPCTNLAEALRRDPSLARKCHFVGMHGSLHVGYSGVFPPDPETNVRLDVAAFRAVLAAPWMSIHLAPLDTCGSVVLDGRRYAELRDSRHPLTIACMENYRIWSQRVDWMTVDFVEQRTSTLFDNVAVAMAYRKDFFEFETIPIVVTDGGMTCHDPAGIPVALALRWRDFDGFLDHITGRMLAPDHGLFAS